MIYLPKNLIDQFVAHTRQYQQQYPSLTKDQLCVVALTACQPYKIGELCRIFEMTHTELEVLCEDLLRAGLPLKFYGLNTEYYVAIGDVDQPIELVSCVGPLPQARFANSSAAPLPEHW